MNIINFDQLPDHIELRHSITYIGIGTSCYATWSPFNHQQYLYLIRHLKESFPSTQINLILIDPHFTIENPPICVNETYSARDQYYLNHYSNGHGIDIYVFDQSIIYLPQYMDYRSDNLYDITPMLVQFNHLCARHDAVLLVHDFSGLGLDQLALYFDPLIDHHHIMYDLSGRCGEPCMNNMTRIHCLIEIEEKIEIISPMCLKLDQLRSYLTTELRPQIVQYVKYLTNLFIELYFHNFRRFKVWQKSIIQKHEIATNKRVIRSHDLRMLDHLHGTHLLQLYETDQIDELITIMSLLLTKQCDDLSTLYQIDVYEILKIILSTDQPDQWIDPLMNYFQQLRFC